MNLWMKKLTLPWLLLAGLSWAEPAKKSPDLKLPPVAMDPSGFSSSTSLERRHSSVNSCSSTVGHFSLA